VFGRVVVLTAAVVAMAKCIRTMKEMHQVQATLVDRLYVLKANAYQTHPYPHIEYMQMQYMNMNGEMVTSDASAGPGKMLCLSCFPCFVEPCGEERREEYKRCLFSFTLPLSVVQVR
jgi:hypothetical protein